MNATLAVLILLTIPVVAAVITNLLRNVLQWQNKEYRFDRMFSYIRYEKDYRDHRMTIWYAKIALTAVLIMYLIEPQISTLLITVPVLFILYLFEIQFLLSDLLLKRLQRPRIKSVRNLIVLCGAFILSLLPVIAFFIFTFSELRIPVNMIDYSTEPSSIREFIKPNPTDSIPLLNVLIAITLLFALAADFLAPWWTALLVFLTEPLALYKRGKTIERAKLKIQNRDRPLKVVALTGSFGKSSTKELIHRVLSQQFSTAKTRENKNTAVGIAEEVLRNLKPETEIFVAEMGAYKKGEILESTKILPPDIAIVTAIGEQHVSLFGSIPELIKAKSEIVQGAKSDATVIINGNSQGCLVIAKNTEKKVIFTAFSDIPEFSEPSPTTGKSATSIKKDETSEQAKKNNLFFAKNIKKKGGKYEYELVYQEESYPTSIKVPTKAHLSNILITIATCHQLGMKIKTILEFLELQDLTTPYLTEGKGIQGAIVINDGRSVNYSGFQAALRFLSKTESEGQRWVFTQGIIELGKERQDTYRKLAQDITNHADVLVTNDRLLLDLCLDADEDFTAHHAATIHDFVHIFQFHITSEDIALFEGSFPGDFYRQTLIPAKKLNNTDRVKNNIPETKIKKNDEN